MRLSNTDVYAFKALAYLGTLPAGSSIQSDVIAEATGVPKPYLVRLLASLSSHGIIVGRRGLGGGYSLARPAEQIPLSQVIRAMDGPVAPLSCVSLNWHKDCPEETRCHVRGRVWLRMREAVLAVLEATSVADLVEDAKAGVDYTHCLEHLLRPSNAAVQRSTI
jgi:Rrf2 family transcriptional regulator, cysteine metabolism repressor